jgi:molybdopterin molybdotransferase
MKPDARVRLEVFFAEYTLDYKGLIAKAANSLFPERTRLQESAVEEFISVERADNLLQGALTSFPDEEVALGEAQGRVLRVPVSADREHPPFNRVMMDGIAFRLGSFEAGRRSFRIERTIRAGERPFPLEDPEACVEIMTGAALPAGCDCVVPVEQIRRVDCVAEVSNDISPKTMQHVHRQASDYGRGEVLVRPGRRLDAAAIGVAASVGCAVLRVSRLPKVAVVATGDELVDVTEVDVPSHRIRRSNDSALAAALRLRGLKDVTACHVPDDPERLRDETARLLSESDVLVLTGGVSMGAFDYVPRVLHAVGVKALFHKVRQRPGKPLLFGLGREGQSVFALPGNPVSALVCLYRYVLPQLEKAMGIEAAPPERAALDRAYDARTDLTCFLPVRVSTDETGRLLAEPRPTNSSGDFASLVGTNGFVELEAGRREFPAGYAAPLIRWSM